MKRDVKGYSMVDLFILAISAIVVVLFFGGWIYGFGLLTDTMEGVEIPGSSENLNFSQITQDTLGNLNTGFGFLRLISLLMLVGYSISILISAFIIRKHPALGLVVFFLITLLAVLFSIQITNEYMDLLQDPVLGPTLQTFSGSNFILVNLPTWITIIGFVGLIIVFSGLPRDRELGGGVF